MAEKMDILTEIADIPADLLMRVYDKQIEVSVSGRSKKNNLYEKR